MAAEATDPDAEVERATVQVVEFVVGGERFAIDVDDVDSIEELTGATRVPRTNQAIDGVMDLRGEITAIINPRVHLDVDSETVAMEQQVLVLDQSKDKQKLGLRVDQVVGVEEYFESDVVDPENFAELDTTGVTKAAIQSIIKRPSEESDFEPVGWIDVDEIISLSRQQH